MSEHNEYEDQENNTGEDQHKTNIKGNILSLIRTTQRNYINLTNIADNKAHILISINSLMLTVLIPITLANYQMIMDLKLYLPIGLFSLTCLLTIIYAVKVLIPFSDHEQETEIKHKKVKRSPFFFTNYADLSLEQYELLFHETLADKESTNNVIISDLYFFGLNLSIKYKLVRTAYYIFNAGIILSFMMFVLTLIF